MVVRGSDRVRWLNGMVTNEVEALTPGDGCYALLLTPQGRIVADFHVLVGEHEHWLELERAAIPVLLRVGN